MNEKVLYVDRSQQRRVMPIDEYFAAMKLLEISTLTDSGGKLSRELKHLFADSRFIDNAIKRLQCITAHDETAQRIQD